MGKELPYFKFNVAEWLTGDIVYEPFNVQGLFINVCAIYWQRSGKLSMDDINKRFKNPVELKELTDRFFSLSDGFISISFLDEQFQDRKVLSTTNSENGKKGGRPKDAKTQANKATAKRPLSEPKAKQSNIEKRREEKNKNRGDRKIPFSLSLIFDKIKFKEEFPAWPKEKLKHYYEAADRYSTEGNKYINWKKAVEGWAAKDELQGKFKFNSAVTGNKTETLAQRQARLTAENHP